MVDGKSYKEAQQSSHLLSFRPLFGTLADLIVAGFLINILALALPLSLLQMYDRIIPNKSLSTLGILIPGVLMAMFLEATVQLIRGRMTGWTGARFEHKISCQGMKHLMGVPLRKYESDEPDLYAEELGAAGQVKDFYSGQALLVLLDLPFVFIYIAVIGLIGGWLAAVTIGLLVVFIVIATTFGNKLKALIGDRSLQDDRRYNFLSETFQGIHSVKTMSMEHMMHRRYEQIQEKNVEQGAMVADSSSLSSGMGSAFSQIMTVGIVAVGSVLSVDQSITPGALAGCIMLATRSLQPLRQSLGVWIRFQSFSVAKDRLTKLFELPNHHRETYDHVVDDIKGAIEIKNVKVELPDKTEPLFENLNLSIRANECVVILGDSGSGKTSFMNLINGTLYPDSGEVLIDGMSVDKIAPNDLHSRVAYLPQQGKLVSGTIMENLTMFDDSLIERAFKVSEEIGLNHVVAAMRLGYETPVGEGSQGAVTGGILQRIAIARAIIHEPKIIMFDEANIAIDGVGDVLLLKYLESMKGKATIILVTHRPSYIRMADKVYVIKDRKLAVSSLEEHMSFYKMERDYSKMGEDRPHSHDWQIADTIQHFNKTSDFSLCFPALLSALEWNGARRSVAEALPHIGSPMDLSCLRSVMANLDFQSSSYRTKFDDLEPRLLPCLFVPDDGPAKVIISVSKETGFTVFNSDTVSVEIGKSYSEEGEAYIFKSVERKEFTAPQGKDGWVRQIMSRFKKFIILSLGITIFSTFLSLATPLFVMGTFNFVLPMHDMKMALVLLIGVALAFILDWRLKRVKSGIMSFVSGRTEYIISNSIFKKIMALPTLSIEKVPVSEQVARIKDLESLRNFFIGPLAMLVYELPSMFVFVIVLAIINPWILLVIVGMGAVYALLGALTFSTQARYTTEASKMLSQRNEFISETLNNMRILRTSGSEDRWLKRFNDISGTAVVADFQANQFGKYVAAVAHFVAMSAGVASMTIVGISAMNGAVAGGSIIATMIIVWRLTSPLQNAFMSSTTLVRIINSVRQIDNLMKMNVEENDSKRQSVRPAVKGAVSLSRVSFRYSMISDPALLGVTFDVKPGELVSLAGPNGSGKSTLLKLLVRSCQPQAGSISLDNVDIRQLAPSDFREEVSYLPQNCEIFYGTISQNLRLSHPIATDDEIRWAAGKAGILEDILALEQGSGSWKRRGFEVRISNSQSDLLANGFRQRLGLARTFLKPAPLVLLDEPGNGLDAEGEDAFLGALSWLRGNSTIFLVSHRPSHLKLSDKVIYFEHGAIRAMGPFDNENVKRIVMAGLGA